MTQAVRFTYEDLEQFPDDNKRRELIDGEVYTTSTFSVQHQRVIGQLLLLVGIFLQRNPLGEIVVGPLNVIFSEENDDVAVPDLLYISNKKRSIISERGIEGAPDWLIEVTSPSTCRRDFGVKLKLYQKYGVPLYWIIDLDAEMIHVWDEGEHEVYKADDVLKVPLLPGLEHPTFTLLML